MKNYWLRALVVAVVFAATVGAAAGDAHAQRRSRRGGLTKGQVGDIIRRVETRVDGFTASFDDALDRSRLDGTRREDDLNRRAQALESATDELRREFDRRDTWQENRDEVRRCLNVASDINAVIHRRRLRYGTERAWAALRYELNALARAYDLPAVGGSYR